MPQTSLEKRVEVFESWTATYNDSIVALMQRKFGMDYRDAIRGVVAMAHPAPGENILDVATGTGTVAIALAEAAEGDCHITGIDITAAMIEAARKNVAERGMEPVFTFQEASAEDLPFAADTFDLVTSSLALHHTNVVKVLREVRRVLRPGGRAVIADVTANRSWRGMLGPMARVFDQMYMFGTESNDLFCEFHTSGEWRRLMREAGFKETLMDFHEPKHFFSRGIAVIRGIKPNN